MSWWPTGSRPAGVAFEQAVAARREPDGTPCVLLKLSNGSHLSMDMEQLADMCRHHDDRLHCAATPDRERRELLRERGLAVRAAAVLHHRFPQIPIPQEIVAGTSPAPDPDPTPAQQRQVHAVYGPLMQRLTGKTGPAP